MIRLHQVPQWSLCVIGWTINPLWMCDIQNVFQVESTLAICFFIHVCLFRSLPTVPVIPPHILQQMTRTGLNMTETNWRKDLPARSGAYSQQAPHVCKQISILYVCYIWAYNLLKCWNTWLLGNMHRKKSLACPPYLLWPSFLSYKKMCHRTVLETEITVHCSLAYCMM